MSDYSYRKPHSFSNYCDYYFVIYHVFLELTYTWSPFFPLTEPHAPSLARKVIFWADLSQFLQYLLLCICEEVAHSATGSGPWTPSLSLNLPL